MNDQPISHDVLRRARGALLGQAIGDALGTTVEFESAAQIEERFPNGLRDLIGGGPFRLLPGQVTDDTELALALARSLAEKENYDDDAVATAYSQWYRSGPFDIGSTTARAFGGRGGAEQMRARASQDSQANGSLMRQSPLGVFGWRLDADALAVLSCRDSTLSHPHVACQESCVAFTHAIAFAIRTGAGPAEVYEETTRFMDGRVTASQSGVLKAITDARQDPPEDFYHQMGWVLTALQNAFFRLLHSASPEGVLVETVTEGGDSDTNACIAGALVGAVRGETGIPARWISTLLACKSPRPLTYSCHDLRELADKLLRAGG
jgi:ADP-ribosylglycohydrolase